MNDFIDVSDCDREWLINLYMNDDAQKYIYGGLSLAEATEKTNRLINKPESIFLCKKLVVDNENVGFGIIFKCHDFNKYYEVGYIVNPEHAGNGFGKKILANLVGILKKEVTDRFLALVDTKNIPSVKVLEKNGFVKSDLVSKKYSDTCLYYEFVV